MHIQSLDREIPWVPSHLEVIEAHLAQIRALIDMQSPRSKKDVRG